MGGLARCRTLHEIAVTAIVLGEYSSKEGFEDLPRRYIEHHYVLNYSDALIYQRDAAKLGEEKFSDSEMAELKRLRDEVISKYGPEYATSYGWAAGIGGKKSPRFSDLEKIAGVSHLRTYYKLASHHIHSDAKDAILNVMRRGDKVGYLYGRTNIGLAEPAGMALGSVAQCFSTHVCALAPIDPRDLVAMKAVQELVTAGYKAFAAGDESVNAAEERYQAEQNRQAP